MTKVDGTEIVSGGAKRARYRRPRVPGWKPLMGGETSVNGRPASTRGRMGAAAPMAATVATTALQYDPKVQAGMLLLRTAKRNPKARRKVQVIAARAADGDPRAKQTMRTLRIAKAVENQKRAAAIKQRRQLLVPAPLASADEPNQSVRRKAGLFHHWEKGAG